MTAPALSYSDSELRYRRLFEAARDGILIVDPETRKIIDVNPFLEEFLGYTRDDFLGKELFEIGLLKDAAASQAAFRQLQANGYIRYEDLPLKTKDGRHVDVEFVSNLYQEGDQLVIQCNIRDITARKHSDDALRASEERFQLLARAASDVIRDWDLVTNQLWWSEGFARTFGYPASEIASGIESWTGRIHPEDVRRVFDGVRHTIENGAESWSAEYRFRCKNDTYASVQDNGFILRDGTGKGIRMVGGMRDLTERKKIEAQYVRAQRMDSIGTLAGGIAHDLNNVLTPILMSIELLEFEANKDQNPRRLKILNTIHLSCRRGYDLVKQILSFAQGVEGMRMAVELRRLVEDLKGIIGETFPRNIAIVTQVSRELWPIDGDPSQLQQVLLNLAVNARDAMPHGGTLTVAAANITLDALYAGTCQQASAGRHVLLQVSDTGTGIPAEIRERIFEPFFTTKEVGKGTGLGLSTAHTIVKSHGGFVNVDSAIGVGTTFKIFLPAGPALQLTATRPPFQSNLLRGRDELVLVVDDESAIRHITQQALEAFGYRVITAKDGAEAVVLYAQQTRQIAVVLTDMTMPIMDGATTIQVLKRINPSVRIIAVSGREVTDSVARLTKAGVHDFLAKPYDAKTLVRLVREVLDRPALAAPTAIGRE